MQESYLLLYLGFCLGFNIFSLIGIILTMKYGDKQEKMIEYEIDDKSDLDKKIDSMIKEFEDNLNNEKEITT